MGHQVSHAFAFTGLVVFIMAAPYLLVTYLGHTTMAFIVMQICLIVPFVIVANLAGKLTDCFGIDAVITAGAICQMIGGVAMLLLVVSRPDLLSAVSLTLVMLPVAIGLGFRSGPGFARAMTFCGKHTGSAGGLMMFTMMGMAALGTQIVAPYLVDGPLAVAITMVTSCTMSLAALLFALRPDSSEPVTVEE